LEEEDELNTMRLEEKVALITGIGSGIGRAAALLFAQEGARIVGADIDQEKGLEVIEAIRQTGREAVFIRTDVSEKSEVKKLVEKALAFGKIDVLFNNAGVEVVKNLKDTTEEEWDRTINVNLKSVFLCCKYTIPKMIKNGGGVVINNASVAGLVGSFSPAYSASKGGVIAMTKTLAVELATDNIRVNCICPGAIETPMLRRVLEKQGNAELVRDERTKSYPMGRFGTPEEVAQAALFLACDESTFMTGAVVVVDGGFTSR
jgi:NAD(P)-dependent dehydrogenase (short-subunit alcohol dehydrogenase family)